MLVSPPRARSTVDSLLFPVWLVLVLAVLVLGDVGTVGGGRTEPLLVPPHVFQHPTEQRRKGRHLVVPQEHGGVVLYRGGPVVRVCVEGMEEVFLDSVLFAMSLVS